VSLDHWGVYTNVLFNNKEMGGVFKFEDVEPDYFWWPLITLMIIGLLVIVVRISYNCFMKKRDDKKKFDDLEQKFLNNDNNNEKANGAEQLTKKDIKPAPIKERLQCLDTFRGLTMFGMVFVNYQGGNYEFFNHSLWNGMTFADCIFPFFMWIMGVSAAYATKREYTVAKKTSIYRICIRSLKLFLLGVLVNQNWDLNTFRYMGVLQRFA